MDSENKFWLTITGMCFSAVLLLILGSMFIYTKHAQKMAYLGYEEQTIQGMSGTVWQKIK